MGFLNTADDMVDNSMKVMKDVLDSKFTSFIQNSGTPILVTYYSLNEVMTTVDTGTESIDSELGDHSPLRFNKILNFPVYGLGNGGGLIPSKEELEGGLIDLNIELELIILPNTIKPNGYDYFVYTYDDNTSITFKVTDYEMSTIKNNNYYKIMVTLKDINDDQSEKDLNNQTVEDMECILNRFGTTDRCIIKKSIFDTANDIERVIEYITELYIDAFYVDRYKCVCFKRTGENSLIFDPYLTKFLYDNNILDYQKNRYITVIQHDTRDVISRNYNKSLYKNVELRDKSKLFNQLRTPVLFSTSSTNPFNYYGEESAFTLDLESYKLDDFIPELTGLDRRSYIPELLLYKIRANELVGDWEKFEESKDIEVPMDLNKPDKTKMDLSELYKHEIQPKPVEKPKYKVIPSNDELFNNINSSNVVEDEDDVITNIDEDETTESPSEEITNTFDDVSNGDYYSNDDADYDETEDHPIIVTPYADHSRCELHDNRPSKEYFYGVADIVIDSNMVTSDYTKNSEDSTRIPDTSVFGYDENKYTLFYWNLIITYINKGNLMDLLEKSNVTIEDLLRIDIENDYETLIYIPIVLYILHEYVSYIRDNG